MSAAKKAADFPPTVQTVKLSHELFVRLKLYGAETRRSSQDILLAALEEYLNRRRSD